MRQVCYAECVLFPRRGGIDAKGKRRQKKTIHNASSNPARSYSDVPSATPKKKKKKGAVAVSMPDPKVGSQVWMRSTLCSQSYQRSWRFGVTACYLGEPIEW